MITNNYKIKQIYYKINSDKIYQKNKNKKNNFKIIQFNIKRLFLKFKKINKSY